MPPTGHRTNEKVAHVATDPHCRMDTNQATEIQTLEKQEKTTHAKRLAWAKGGGWMHSSHMLKRPQEKNYLQWLWHWPPPKPTNRTRVNLSSAADLRMLPVDSKDFPMVGGMTSLQDTSLLRPKHDWAEDMIRFYNGYVTDGTHKNNVPKNYTQGNNRIQMLGWQWQATWKIRADPNLPRVTCWGGQMRRETNTKEVDTTSAPTATVALLTQLLLLPALHHDPRPAASSFQ